MYPSSSLRALHFEPRNVSDTASPHLAIDNALLAHTSDSWSFQHFLDRITHVTAQAEHVTRDLNVTALTGRAGNARVKGLWDAIGFDEDHVLHAPGGEMSIERVFISCKTPLIASVSVAQDGGTDGPRLDSSGL
jgi:hypothetical protein